MDICCTSRFTAPPVLCAEYVPSNVVGLFLQKEPCWGLGGSSRFASALPDAGFVPSHKAERHSNSSHPPATEEVTGWLHLWKQLVRSRAKKQLLCIEACRNFFSHLLVFIPSAFNRGNLTVLTQWHASVGWLFSCCLSIECYPIDQEPHAPLV